MHSKPNGSLERIEPTDRNPDSAFWVDEAIWGHRLYDEQEPWFVYLEFLNVCASQAEEKTLLDEPRGMNHLVYKPKQRLYLRNILFNYPIARMEEIQRREAGDDSKWKAWMGDIGNIQQGLPDPDFSYLREHFESFEDFLDIVRLVHSGCLEMDSNKRWTSKFVFPYCPEALFEDLDRRASSNDRRFFGRTGELVYLMLCRSAKKDELKQLILSRLLPTDGGIWSSVIRALQPAGPGKSVERAGGFLPYASHPIFDSLCEDWISLLSLRAPMIDLTPHLVRLVGLHVMRYQQVLAHQALGEDHPSYYVCEIIAPKRTLVRELSIEAYHENNTLSLKTVLAYIEAIRETDDWRKGTASNDPYQACRDVLVERCMWPRDADDYEGAYTPEDLFADLRTKVERRHKQHVGNIHRVYGREIGLISKRGTNRLRYAPTDALLRTLVLTMVPSRMEFKEFLGALFKRYEIVIGDTQASLMHCIEEGDIDKKAFQSNSERLEQRLSCMGLLKRLSDGCAYLVNPYMAQGK